jgi:DNA-binding response OmpR family regulator
MEQQQNDQLSRLHAGASRGCILIVNAAPTFGRVLQAFLQLRGWSPLVCSGREAMRDWNALSACGVVLDFDGPGLDGFDLLECLHAGIGRAPVLVCSRYPEPAAPERDSLRELGVKHWLQRPCSMDAIAAALDAACHPLEACAGI